MMAETADLQWVLYGSRLQEQLELRGYHPIRTKEERGQVLALMASPDYHMPAKAAQS